MKNIKLKSYKNNKETITPEQAEQRRTIKKKELFLEVYEKTLGSIKETCRQAGIDRTTFYKWRDSDPEFLAKIRGLFHRKLEDVEEKLNKAIVAEDGTSIRYFLDRRHPAYRPRVKLEGPKPGERTLEQEFDEAEWRDDTPNIDYGETNIKQLNDNSAKIADPKQAGTGSAVQTKPCPAILLEKKDEKKPDIKSKAGGIK